MFLAAVLTLFGLCVMATTGFLGLIVYLLALLIWCTMVHDKAQEAER